MVRLLDLIVAVRQKRCRLDELIVGVGASLGSVMTGISFIQQRSHG
jgi:hypothetical protein